MNKKEAEREWRERVLPYDKVQYERGGVPDYPARRESWNNFVDGLCRDQRVTSRQCDTWLQPRECRGRHD